MEVQPGFLVSLLSIIKSDAAINVKQAAAIYFKNRVQQGWDPSKTPCVADHDKLFVRDTLLTVIVQVNELSTVR